MVEMTNGGDEDEWRYDSNL